MNRRLQIVVLLTFDRTDDAEAWISGEYAMRKEMRFKGPVHARAYPVDATSPKALKRLRNFINRNLFKDEEGESSCG